MTPLFRSSWLPSAVRNAVCGLGAQITNPKARTLAASGSLPAFRAAVAARHGPPHCVAVAWSVWPQPLGGGSTVWGCGACGLLCALPGVPASRASRPASAPLMKNRSGALALRCVATSRPSCMPCSQRPRRSLGGCWVDRCAATAAALGGGDGGIGVCSVRLHGLYESGRLCVYVCLAFCALGLG